jgi:hypothetical protein
VEVLISGAFISSFTNASNKRATSVDWWPEMHLQGGSSRLMKNSFGRPDVTSAAEAAIDFPA